MNGFWIALDKLRSALWFVPALIVAGAVALAVALVEVEWVGRSELADRWPRIFGAGADGSRELLAAIAGSMITVAGVTFSITVVALALTASLYSSRILRTFMRDRANQMVLGVFVGVFAYCLVVLRTIRGGDGEPFVPALAVLGGLLLALVAIGFLIFFIHHVATSIQATRIIAAAAEETVEAIDRLFPSELGEAAEGAVREGGPSPDARGLTPIPSRKTGYIQAVDGDALLALARERNVVVRMDAGIGDFAVEDCPLASVSDNLDKQMERRLNAAYTIGRERTVQQDAAYGIRQIVDVALKALSPGINDTTTALNCVDFLGAILARLSTREVETPFRSDGRKLRVITRGPTFADLLSGAVEPVRQNAESNAPVLERLVEVLELVRARANDPGRRQAIARQTELILDAAQRGLAAPEDRARVARALGTQALEPVHEQAGNGATRARATGFRRAGRARFRAR